MVRRARIALVALFTLTLVSGSVVRAHEGHDHKIMGTITMAAADHIMLKDKDGRDVTVQVTKDTKVKSRPAMKVEDIKVGTRVVVTATMEKNKSLKAKTIEVGMAPGAVKQVTNAYGSIATHLEKLASFYLTSDDGAWKIRHSHTSSALSDGLRSDRLS